MNYAAYRPSDGLIKQTGVCPASVLDTLAPAGFIAIETDAAYSNADVYAPGGIITPRPDAPITFAVAGRVVTLGGVPVDLSPMEYRLLAYLMLKRGEVVTQQDLVENVYGDDEQATNTIEVLVGRLRRKIGAGWIETRRGFGYMLPETAP